jgi:type I restriction enzyme, S subunit
MSWTTKTLGELCFIEKGNIGINNAIPGDYPLVVTSEERKSHNEFQFDDEAVIIPLVSSTGHGHKSLKRIHYQSGKFAVGSILCAVIPKDKSILKAEYLYRFLYLNKERELVGRMKGMANVSLPIKEIAKIEIPVPPLDEQENFVESYLRLEESKSDIASEFTHQLDLIKQLRQSFLREAMQGKLTAKWRESNPDVEPASELLKKIKVEKEKLVKEGKSKKDKPLTAIKENDIPFEIPESWEWCRVGELAEFRRGPFGSALTKSIFVKEGYKVYEQRNAIYDNHILGDYYVTPQKYLELKSFKVEPFDLIVSCSGATLGRIAEIPSEAVEGIINQALMRIRLYQIGIKNSFYIRLFRSPYIQDVIFKKAWGTAIPNMVGLSEIKQILIPLPPLSEQQQIVTKLDELMQYCDKLAESIKTSQQQNEMLLKQVLREALEVGEVIV